MFPLILQVFSGSNPISQTGLPWKPYGCFLKCWYPTTMSFPTQNDHFEVFWGYHHLRKHPYHKGLALEKNRASPRFTTPPIKALGYLPCSGVHGGSPGNYRQNPSSQNGMCNNNSVPTQKNIQPSFEKKLKHYIKTKKKPPAFEI